MSRSRSSIVDQAVSSGVAGLQVPGDADAQGGNAVRRLRHADSGRPQLRAVRDRRVCAGNTNCIPICPIQAKWDPTVTLGKRARHRQRDRELSVGGVQRRRRRQRTPRASTTTSGRATPTATCKSTPKSVTGKIYVLAAHAIENAKLLLLSNNQKGIANSSDQVGRNLMDHVALSDLGAGATSRSGAIAGRWPPPASSRCATASSGRYRASFRMEIGNEGWNFSTGDPYTTTLDFITERTTRSSTPGRRQRLGGTAAGAEAQQPPHAPVPLRPACSISRRSRRTASRSISTDRNHRTAWTSRGRTSTTASTPYTMEGFRMAADTCSAVYKQMGAQEFTQPTVNPYPPTESRDRATSRTKARNYHYLRRGPRHGHAPHGDRPDKLGRRREPALARRPESLDRRQRQLPHGVRPQTRH